MVLASYGWEQNLLKVQHHYSSKALQHQKQGIMYAMKSCETWGYAFVDDPIRKEGLIMDCWQSRVKLVKGDQYEEVVKENERLKNARPRAQGNPQIN